MQSILQHLFNKNAIQDIPVEEIEQCVRQYPFFPFGQFLLTKKLQPHSDIAYREQLQKTAVYFHDTLWLLHQIRQEVIEDKAEAPVAEDVKTTNGSVDFNTAMSSHDMVEDVVLHQEAVYQSPEEASVQRNGILDNAVHPGAGKKQGMKDLAAEGKEVQTAVAEAPVPYQAYHTVDYFASQGIKISNEIQTDDKLGKQLKSFTEWLKSMRKLPEAMEEVLEKSSDTEVEELAAHSLEENEVITEAMAEVLVKQGKHQLANDVYHKLSLLNPHKIAYFAAKIDKLNLH